MIGLDMLEALKKFIPGHAQRRRDLIRREDQDRIAEKTAWDQSMIKAGWSHYMVRRPEDRAQLIEVTRREWDKPQQTRVELMDPQMNVYGLWWRAV